MGQERRVMGRFEEWGVEMWVGLEDEGVREDGERMEMGGARLGEFSKRMG